MAPGDTSPFQCGPAVYLNTQRVVLPCKKLANHSGVRKMVNPGKKGLRTFGPRNSVPNPVHSGPAFLHIREQNKLRAARKTFLFWGWPEKFWGLVFWG